MRSEIPTRYQWSDSSLSMHFASVESSQLLTRYPGSGFRCQESRLSSFKKKNTHIIESQLLFSVDLMKKQVSPFQRMTRTVCARIPPEKRSLCKWVMLPRSSPAVRSMMALMAMAFRTAWRVVLQNE